jgi:hypothetical protein
MSMPFPIIPGMPNVSDEAALVWNDVTASLTKGDVEALQNAIKGFLTLSAIDKKTLEYISGTAPSAYYADLYQSRSKYWRD